MEEKPKTLKEWVNDGHEHRNEYLRAAADLPRQLIPIAKVGPKGLPKLLSANMTDLTELSTILGSIEVADSSGAPAMGVFGVPPVVQPGSYVVSNYTPSRTLDASTATLAEALDFLCTLVDDMKTVGYIG